MTDKCKFIYHKPVVETKEAVFVDERLAMAGSHHPNTREEQPRQRHQRTCR